ncbi:hypothetical protein ACFLS1_02745 [Verrucomicrobiota bacterium]
MSNIHKISIPAWPLKMLRIHAYRMHGIKKRVNIELFALKRKKQDSEVSIQDSAFLSDCPPDCDLSACMRSLRQKAFGGVNFGNSSTFWLLTPES